MTGFEKRDGSGYTLVELMIALLLSMIAMVGMYKTFASFSANSKTQEQLIAMNQDLRFGIGKMAKDIGDAGYNPKGVVSSTIGILLAKPNTMKFTMDIDGGQSDGLDNDADATTDEADEATYGNGAISGSFVNGSTEIIIYNRSAGDLKRNGQAVVSNIDALNFVYLNSSGAPTTTLASIVSVQITMVARTPDKDFSYIHNETYKNLQGTVVLGHQTSASTKNYRRRALTIDVNCKNLLY